MLTCSKDKPKARTKRRNETTRGRFDAPASFRLPSCTLWLRRQHCSCPTQTHPPFTWPMFSEKLDKCCSRATAIIVYHTSQVCTGIRKSIKQRKGTVSIPLERVQEMNLSMKTLCQVLVCISVGFLLVVPLVFPSHRALQNATEFATESSATAVAVD